MAIPIERGVVLPVLRRRFAFAVGRSFEGLLGRLGPGIRAVVDEAIPTKAEAGLVEEVEILLRRLAWDAETRILSTLLRPFYVAIADSGAGAVARELSLTADFELSARPVRTILSEVGTRITGVTDTSRIRIAREIANGIEKGLSVEQIVKGVPPGTTSIRGPVPTFRGIASLVDSWGSTGTGRRLGPGTGPGTRAYLIAQTETANAFNRSAIESYRASGLVDFVEVFDGPDCGWTYHDDPDLAHGSVRSLEAARRTPLSHPRCQRAFGAALRAAEESASPLARPTP